MARDSIDILGLLRKRRLDGDVDFLLEALRVVADAVMEPMCLRRSVRVTVNAAPIG